MRGNSLPSSIPILNERTDTHRGIEALVTNRTDHTLESSDVIRLLNNSPGALNSENWTQLAIYNRNGALTIEPDSEDFFLYNFTR